VREIVGVFEDLLGRALDVQSDPDLVRRIDRPNLCADATVLESHIHWKPGTTLREGISKLLESEGLL
jgi:nucleoside-diphosphate-sugar epimerase